MQSNLKRNGQQCKIIFAKRNGQNNLHLKEMATIKTDTIKWVFAITAGSFL